MAPVLELQNISLSAGTSQLIDGANAIVTSGHRVAVVGPNGCGKSTLLRAIHSCCDTHANDVEYIFRGAGRVLGTFSNSPNATLFVEQDDLQWSKLLSIDNADESEIREMTVPEALDFAIAMSNDDGAGNANDDAESWRTLNIAANDLLEWRTAEYDSRPIELLSPGCAMRAYLAIALRRSNVQLLLLDEPTNHLDLPSILWLQNTIVDSGKTVVFVSHDESFLDGVANHVWDIDPDKHTLTVSGAGFTAYKAAKLAAREKQRAEYNAQQKRHKQLTEAANKLRAASTSGSHFSGTDRDKLQRDFKRDRAGRSGQKAKSIESNRDAEPLVEAVVDHVPLKISLDPVASNGDTVIALGSVALGYDGATLQLPPISLRIDYGERVALVGFNGVGKTTLLRTIVGDIDPIRGSSTFGRDLKLGMLTQEHESLQRQGDNVTARQYLTDLVDPGDNRTGWRLLKYGLTRTQLDCPIAELNPGARARILLASFSMRRVNCLVLDEPTNHLDDEAISEVLATLKLYKGTVLIVSHNRHFLESLDFHRVLRLSSNGLQEIESVKAFSEEIELKVRKVLDSTKFYY